MSDLIGDTQAPPGLAFDPAALREKYRAERDKRLRADGNDQYVEVKAALAHYADDPYAGPPPDRAPLTDTVDVIVVGGGFGGLLAAARLRQAGVDGIRVIEKAGDFGGTWYWNRYPGAACDIESYVYLPLLEETGFIPSEKYAAGAEILAYSQAIARHFDLYRDACFQTEVTRLDWLEAEQRWLVTTSRGDAMRARFVAMANGPLHRPKLPGIPGIGTFTGHSFHTSRWDYAYTGGSQAGGLSGLAGKRVGLIGTGATAVQCVPHVAEAAGRLDVFQRTPSSISSLSTAKPAARMAAISRSSAGRESIVRAVKRCIRPASTRSENSASRKASITLPVPVQWNGARTPGEFSILTRCRLAT